MKRKNVSMAQMYPIIKEVIESGGEVSIIATGESMQPMLYNDIDSILLTKVTGKLKKYDLPFYQRKNGAFVVHRVVEVLDDEYVMCGDNQVIKEKGITDNQIIAIVKGFTRKNKKYNVTDKKYKLYCFVWVNSFIIRKKYRGFKTRVKKLIYRK